jgi:hypothetical protein
MGWRETMQEKATMRQRLMGLYKVLSGCARCGYNENEYGLEFHHRDPATKLRTVGASLCGSSALLEAEVAKCDVLCGTCHNIETRSPA